MTALARIDAPLSACAARDFTAIARLESGAVEVRGRIEGPAGAPVIAVIGGVSAHRRLGGTTGWWPAQTGLGKPLDPIPPAEL